MNRAHRIMMEICMGLHECGLLFKNRLSKNSKELQQIMDKPWLADHIKNGHGPLCAAYPQEYTSEGDTPSFMPLIRNGLEQHTDYTLGGWGGRPEYKMAITCKMGMI